MSAPDLRRLSALTPARVRLQAGAGPTALPDLLRYAGALTGDPHTGADVVQEVLVRAHGRWARIAAADRPDLYVRKMVTNEHLSWRRRWHTRSVVPTEDGALHASLLTTTARARAGG